MEHLEFINADHFRYNYYRIYATGELAQYIDFCWETDFSKLLKENPKGFADVLFPNIGYTYIINLGTPFTMELEKSSYKVKNEGFIPRHHYVTCHHSEGNQLFGIKFKVCPILFEKHVDFSEYKEQIYPLAYLIERNVMMGVKQSNSFDERVNVVFQHYKKLISKYKKQFNYVHIVTEIIDSCMAKNDFNKPLEELALSYNVSLRTLQRYFNACTSFSSKQALQAMRIRQAVKSFTADPASFSFSDYGYYDYSHFSKHLQQFTGKYCKTFLKIYTGKSLMDRTSS